MVFLLGCLLIHFSSVFIYSNPFNSEKSKAQFYSQVYIYPYFHQGWNLFAPIPTSNYKLFCEDKSSGLKPIDIFEEIKVNHQSNRLKGYGPLLVAFSNSIHYFEQDAAQLKTMSEIKNNAAFKIIEHSAKNYLQSTRKLTIENLKLILIIEDSHSSQQKVYFNHIF